MKEGTTLLKGKAGLPCCESPVPAAKKWRNASKTWGRHWYRNRRLRHLHCRWLCWCGRNWERTMSQLFGGQSSLNCCAMNKASAGEFPPSSPETTAWDIVGKSSSDFTVCEFKVLKSLSPPATGQTGAICKLLFVKCEPMAKYNQGIERISKQNHSASYATGVTKRKSLAIQAEL